MIRNKLMLVFILLLASAGCVACVIGWWYWIHMFITGNMDVKLGIAGFMLCVAGLIFIKD